MVTSGEAIRITLLSSVGLLALIVNAFADVTASVDRNSVDLNESFVFEITVNANIDVRPIGRGEFTATDSDAEPNLSVLDENFYRGQLSQLNNTSIINGQISRSRIWTVALMARVAGQQDIPAVSVGSESSKPISIMVNEPANAPPGEADVFIISEVDQTEAYVQSQVLYRFKVYRAVATRQQNYRDPVISGAEVLIERAGEERSYEALLNGRAYNVMERVLAIYPQSSGEIEISPARFEARILRDGRITGRKVFESDAHAIKILPIPAPPTDFPNASWLPARDVQLSEEWSRELNEVSAGEPVTRKVTVSALSQIETQIPALSPPDVEGMNVYADKPDFSRQFEAEGIRGIRRDQYAMIGVRGGVVKIPKLEVPWWDIEAGEWRVATLPSKTFTIDAPVAETVLPPAIQSGALGDATGDANPAKLVEDEFWKLLSQLIGGVWLLTIFVWWWSSRDRQREPKAPEPPPIYKQQAKFVKAAKKAANAGDKTAVRAALIEWAVLQWPENSPRSVSELAKRVTSPLSEELSVLSASSYSSTPGEWDGSGMATAIRSISVLIEDSEVATQSPLPPLMPPGT